MTPLTYSQQLQAAIPNSRLEVISGGSHMLMIEEAALFNSAVRT